MRANEFIVEKIVIETSYIEKLTSTMIKWVNLIRQEPMDQNSHKSYKKDTDTLVRMLYPTILTYIKPYIRQAEEIVPYITMWGKQVSISDFLSHKLQLRIETSHWINNNTQASVDQKWQPLYNSKKQVRLHNELMLILPTNDYYLLKSPSTEPTKLINNLVNSITHETTHLIQSLQNIKQEIRGKNTTKQLLDPSDDVQYLGTPGEIEAYAQSVVTSIIQSKTLLTKAKIDMLLKFGMTELFGGATIPGMDTEIFNRYKSLFHPYFNQLSTIKDIKLKEKIWRRFLKKVYEKLMAYINSQANKQK